MSLSIVICTINDQEETAATIKSIRDTAGNEPEIVLVDDCSGTSLAGDWRFQNIPNLKLVSNRWRCGCGPSRHIGALNASGDWLLITDSHMRFATGWYEAFINRVYPPTSFGMTENYLRTIYCATCLGLDRDHLDPLKPLAEYNGATYNFHGPDRNAPGKIQTLECVWIDRQHTPSDNDEIPAIMGAGYFIHKDWFLKLGATRFLKTWGCDELFLSMKSWLAGGSVRIMRSVRIGHRFPVKGEHKWFSLPPGHVLFNKIMAAHSLFPPDVAQRLEAKLLIPMSKADIQDVEAAKRLIRDDWGVIASEMALNKAMFSRDAKWLCDRFGLVLP